MSRPRLLDLFCCEGGASIGYYRAGFDVVGVDIAPQPRYPFPFVQADALALPIDLSKFDAVHCSPPCQGYSVTRFVHPDREHPLLIDDVMRVLDGFGGPWVMENVPGAPVPNPVELCGAAMGCTAVDTDGVPLVLRRHRLFGSNVGLLIPPCACAEYRRAGYRVGGVYGGSTTYRHKTTRRGGYVPATRVRRALIGCEHMSRHGLSQSIPPAYTELIGQQLIEACG